MRWMLSGILLSLVGCATQPAPPPSVAAAEIRISGNAGCDASEFFVEFAPSAVSPGPNFRSRLESALTQAAQRDWCAWNASPDGRPAASCRRSAGKFIAEPVSARVEAVFGARPNASDAEAGPCFEHDGDLRFFRVSFFEGKDKFELPPVAVCAAIDMIRREADKAAGDVGPSQRRICSAQATGARSGPVGQGIRVGRECPVRALSGPDFAGGIGFSENLPGRCQGKLCEWQKQRLQLGPFLHPRPGPGASEKGRHKDAVPVVLIGTGAGAASISNRHLASNTTPPITFEDKGPAHPQGKMLTLLARQIVGRSPMYSVRVTDANGRGTTAKLAQALESATFDIPRPHVLSVGVGWRPEHGASRVVEGRAVTSGDENTYRFEQCRTREYGPNEAVRFALALAKFDPRPDGHTLVVSSAGQRSLPASVQPGGRDSLYYPAAWSNRQRAAINPWTLKSEPTRWLTVAPGTIDWWDHRALNTPRQRMWLEVPGVQVRAAPDFDPWTGSAVAATYLAATAARAHGWRGGPRTAAALMRDVYLTGDRVETDHPLIEPRRPNLCTLYWGIEKGDLLPYGWRNLEPVSYSECQPSRLFSRLRSGYAPRRCPTCLLRMVDPDSPGLVRLQVEDFGPLFELTWNTNNNYPLQADDELLELNLLITQNGMIQQPIDAHPVDEHRSAVRVELTPFLEDWTPYQPIDLELDMGETMVTAYPPDGPKPRESLEVIVRRNGEVIRFEYCLPFIIGDAGEIDECPDV